MAWPILYSINGDFMKGSIIKWLRAWVLEIGGLRSNAGSTNDPGQIIEPLVPLLPYLKKDDGDNRRHTLGLL